MILSGFLRRKKMDTFDPVKYNAVENQFLLENVGTAPIVALSKAPPAGVNLKAVRPVLQEVFDREQLRNQSGVTWLGIEAMKAGITRYLAADAKWSEDYVKSRGRVPRFPTMYVKDGKGKYHLSGPGSDQGWPRTWEDAQGNRHRLAMDFDGMDDEVLEAVQAAPKAILHDEDKHRFECPICHHTESYKEDNRGSKQMSWGRMGKHLKTAKVEVSLHQELYTNEFIS